MLLIIPIAILMIIFSKQIMAFFGTSYEQAFSALIVFTIGYAIY